MLQFGVMYVVLRLYVTVFSLLVFFSLLSCFGALYEHYTYNYLGIFIGRGSRGRDRMVVGFTTTCESVPITTKVVSSNPVRGEMYSIQQYVITFVSDLRQVGGFLRVLRFPPPIKLSATI